MVDPRTNDHKFSNGIFSLLGSYLNVSGDIFVAWMELIVAYFLLLFVNRKYVGWVMTTYSLAYLTFVHIERMINDYGGWHLGVSTCIMLQCVHLSSIAWDYVDGAADPINLSSEQKKNAIKDLPSFVEFVAAAVCPTQSFAGPSCNFVDFRDYVNMQGLYKEIPSTVMPCLKRLSTGLTFVLLYVILHGLFPPELLRTPDYHQKGFFTRHFYLFIVALYTKFKYYVGWTMGDAAVIASGQAYNGVDKKTNTPKFDRFYAIDLQAVELSVFAMPVTEGWNHGAHVWLKRYIYFRLNRVINRDVALYLTYITSAFWHGFYPMYFVTFILYAIYTENHKDIHKLCCKYSFMRNPAVFAFAYILSNLGTDYLGMLFDILLFRNVKKFVSGLYWIPLLNIVMFLIFKLTRMDLSSIIIALTKEKKKESGKKETPIVPYNLKIYEIFSVSEKPKAA